MTSTPPSEPDPAAPRARALPAGRWRLPARFAGIVMPVLLSVFMTFVVSLISTLRGVGPVSGFLAIWLSAWALSWAVAFPTLLVVLPVVRRLTAAIVELPPGPHG